MRDIMDIFKDSEGHSLETSSWYRIPPNTSNIYRFKEYEKGRAVFEVFGFDGYSPTYSFMEEQIAIADKIDINNFLIDINNFLEGKRKQISAIEKALAQTSPKFTASKKTQFAADKFIKRIKRGIITKRCPPNINI